MKLSEILQKIDENSAAKKLKNDAILKGIAPLEVASSGYLIYVDQKQYLKGLHDSKASWVLIRESDLKEVPDHIEAIVVENPHLAFAKISHFFKKDEFGSSGKEAIIDPSARIMPNVFLGKNVKIGANCVIMPGVVISDNVEIGANCVIFANVVIYRDSKIGNNIRIHAGSVIGSDGFGYAHTKEGEHIKIEHNGNVVIEDDVEIGANCTIDRAVFGETRIKRGSKIDNLVQIGHNCVIGEHSIIVSQVGLAGSTTTGRNVIMGGQAGTGGHIHIGDNVMIAGRGAVGKNLPPNTKWGGHPLMELDEWMKFYVTLRRELKAKSKKD